MSMCRLPARPLLRSMPPVRRMEPPADCLGVNYSGHSRLAGMWNAELKCSQMLVGAVG